MSAVRRLPKGIRPQFPHYDCGPDAPLPICGIDEAGRGPWAGPVYAAAVILDMERPIAGLADSKQLSEARRRDLARLIQDRALAWGIGFASSAEIDAVNILQATGLAMRRAVEALPLTPGFALIDGAYRFALDCPVRPLVKGDALCASIAAASILAKTARDQFMLAAELDHPGYGFAKHKGYGVPEHARALAAQGPCPLHRMSFAPVRAAGRAIGT